MRPVPVLTVERLVVPARGGGGVGPVSLSVAPGEFVGLIGPNGSGKTTLLRALQGLVPAKGHSSLATLAGPARARAAAWLPQAREIAWPVAVAELVALGRMPHGDAAPAHPAVAAAMTRVGVSHLAERPATALSGGEQARVLLARALAQEAPLMLADEPIAGLDPAWQIRAMEVLAAEAAAGRAVVAALHDLGLALRHCTRLWILDRGRLLADGPPDAVLTPERLAAVFGIAAGRAETAEGPVFQPLRALPAAPSEGPASA